MFYILSLCCICGGHVVDLWLTCDGTVMNLLVGL